MDTTSDQNPPAPGVDAASDAAPPADDGDRADDGSRPDDGHRLIDAAPALARMTITAWWNTAAWALGSSLRLADDVARAAFSLGDTGVPTREDVADAVRREEDEVTLRERGAELLRRSADVRFDDDSHPAYVRILEELAPDEARIIRLLAARGPQASVDVRAGLPLASSLVAPGLTMIASEAGCRRPERVHPYLNNLNRLGLVWFSRETLEDPLPYQVLEAQPEVVEALEQAGRLGRTVRRSIHLTPFGADFCRAALPSDTLEFEAVVHTHSAADPAEDTHSAADPAEVSARHERERNTPLDPVPPSPPPGGAGEHGR
jgi:Abortive infection alpha